MHVDVSGSQRRARTQLAALRYPSAWPWLASSFVGEGLVPSRPPAGGGPDAVRQVSRTSAARFPRARGGRGQAPPLRRRRQSATAAAATRLGLACLAAGLACLLLVSSVFAHAELVGSEPADNAVLASGPPRVQLLFSEPVEPRFFSIRVYDANRARVDRGSPRIASADPRVLEVDLRELDPGTYTTVWRVLSRDGHVARGVFSFGVGGEIQPRLGALLEAPVEGAPFALDAALRWASYLLLMLLVGGCAFRLLVLGPARWSAGLDATPGVSDSAIGGMEPPPPEARARTATGSSLPGVPPHLDGRARALALVCIGLLVPLHLGGLVLQTATVAELPPGDVLRGAGVADLLGSTRYGTLWLVRAALLVGLLVWTAVLLLGRQRRRRPGRPGLPGWWVGAVLGSTALLTLSAGGHASTVEDGPGLAVFLDWLHLLAASLWVGGLVQLALLWGERERQTGLVAAVLPRFSALAGLSVGILLLTGLYASVLHTPEWGALLDTAYGAALSGKLMLVAPLLAIGAANLLRWQWTRRRRVSGSMGIAPGWGAPLGIEIVLAGAVVGVTSILTTLPPATSVLRGQPYRSIQAAGPFLVELAVTPNQAGENRIEIGVRPPPGERRAIEPVSLQLAMLDMDMSPRAVELAPTGSGRFVADDALLSMAGRWDAAVQIAGSETATFRFTVGQAPGANRPAFSPAQVLLLAVRIPQLDGTSETNWPFLGAAGAVALGMVLLVWRAARGTTAPAAEQRLARTSLLLTGLGLLALGLPLGGVALADAYQRSQPPVTSERSIVPPPRDPEAIARGQATYERACAACHGIGGRGDGPSGRALQPPPSDFRVRMAAGLRDEQLYDWISNGKPGTAMPGFRDDLSREQILDLLVYLHTFADL